jgi:hypothetical protein
MYNEFIESIAIRSVHPEGDWSLRYEQYYPQH